MAYRTRAISAVRTAKEFVYRGPIRRGVQLIGIESSLSSAYRSLVSSLEGPTITYRVGETAAVYHNTRFLPRSPPEEPVVRDIVESLRPGDVFYDMGANRGIYTCLAGAYLAGTNGSVVSFEPNPSAVSVLQDNVRLNDLEATVDVFDVAVSDTTGEMEFEVKDDSTGNTLAVSGTGGDCTVETVRTVRVDSLIAAGEIPPPDVIKMDVEGAELNALRGLSRTLQGTSCRLVYCEIHEETLEALGGSSAEVRTLLQNAGYELDRLLDRESKVYIVRAEKETAADQ